MKEMDGTGGGRREVEGNLQRQVENFQLPVIRERERQEGLAHREPHIQRPGWRETSMGEITLELAQVPALEGYKQPDTL